MEQELSRSNSVKIEKALNPSKRQTVLSGRKGRAYADFIEPSTGLSAVAKADSTNPIIFTSAAGFDRTGPVDYINKITTDQTFSGLTANATNFLGFERIDQYTVNKIATTTMPLYDSVFGSDNENKACATFDGTLAVTTFNDFYGNTIRMYNGAAIAAGHPSGSGNSMRFGGTDDFAEMDFKGNINSLQCWTVEFFYKIDNAAVDSYLVTVDAPVANYVFLTRHYDATTILLYLGDGSAANITNGVNIRHSSVGTLTNNTWYHIAIVNEGRNIKAYVNGILGYSILISPDLEISNINKFIFGGTNLYLSGNISNFATWPYAKYTVNSNTYGAVAFAPSTANLTTDTAQQDRYWRLKDRFHIDLSTATANATTFRETYGNTLYFKNAGVGSNQSYIESTTGPGAFGTVKTLKCIASTYSNVEIRNIILPRKWTIEGYFYRTSAATVSLLFSATVPSSYSIALLLPIAGTTLELYVSQNGTTYLTNLAPSTSSAITFSLNTWYHVAVSYDGATYRIYFDGNRVASANSPFSPTIEAAFQIGGREDDNDKHFAGNIFMPILTPYCKYTDATITVPTTFPTPESVYYYDTTKTKMYSGYKSNWTENNTVFLGEAETNATTVNKVITYSINGEIFIDGIDGYGSGLINTGATSTYKITIAHNIGTNRITIDDWWEWKKRIYSKIPGEKNKLMGYSGTDSQVPIQINDRNYFSYLLGASGMLVDSNGGIAGFALDAGNGKLQFKVERNF